MAALLASAWTWLVRARLAVVALLLLVCDAAALQPVDYPQPPDTAAFRLLLSDRERTVTLLEIEKLDLYQVTTPSPWEKGQLVVQGVLLRDFLKEVGLAEADAIEVRAADGYAQTVPRTDWTEGPLLLATRENGELLNRRNQGPTRLVYPLLDHPEYDTPVHKLRWIWLIESIRPID
ncbi:molybdopterin-dependent oxidoreductase [Amorphus orientalis]|uniref:Oxidoreductase molybdopterin-binding domain-containing protein n=1 Tax=Amorphus orientalis TaxID=649198 RepID=A0AAE4AS60_9HYPH|nr:molybdopterin-dependent oxidoreductase [Amorphus orientalis]MDQ0314757.1 hypothetical protein [Amorphus orientalis]